jgi:hypothetical protein
MHVQILARSERIDLRAPLHQPPASRARVLVMFLDGERLPGAGEFFCARLGFLPCTEAFPLQFSPNPSDMKVSHFRSPSEAFRRSPADAKSDEPDPTRGYISAKL